MGYLSSAEIADLWGISERSVRNYCAHGRIEGARLIGKKWEIPETAEKPRRANESNKPKPNALLHRLRQEKASKIKGGIYHKLQIELTYNSNHIEGSQLSLDQTRMIFETSTIGTEGNPVKLDDVIETTNHFRCIDYCLDIANRPLSEPIIKKLHKMLKTDTSEESHDWVAIGEYKQLPNEVGGRVTASPEAVRTEMRSLLQEYGPDMPHTIEEIVRFHVEFERIHPFQDGNGRIGRLIMLKECLANDIVPFVITDEMKGFYYRGLGKWDEETGYLMETCLAAQDQFKEWMRYFRIDYRD